MIEYGKPICESESVTIREHDGKIHVYKLCEFTMLGKVKKDWLHATQYRRMGNHFEEYDELYGCFTGKTANTIEDIAQNVFQKERESHEHKELS